MNTNYRAHPSSMASYFIFTKGDGWYCTMFDNQEFGPFKAYSDAERQVRLAMSAQRMNRVA